MHERPVGTREGLSERARDGEEGGKKERKESVIEGRRGGEAAGCSAEVDVAGPAELATSDGQRR